MHVDHDKYGMHFAEKILIGTQEDGKAELHVASGPYPEGVAKEERKWKKWAEDVKRIAER